MAYQFDNNTPIYLQLQELFQRHIITGKLKPGEQMPTVRDIAVNYGVNPNTVQRALTELERDGLAFSRRTSGRFITEDVEQIKAMRHKMAQQIIDSFIDDMKSFGYDLADMTSILEEHWRDRNGLD